MFDNRTGNAHRVAFLKGIHANGMRRHLTADDDHGNAVHVGSGDAREGIGNARA